MSEPMAEQIAAHERYLRLLADWRDARERGEDDAARRLRPRVDRAEREWHRLVRAADDAMRTRRH